MRSSKSRLRQPNDRRRAANYAGISNGCTPVARGGTMIESARWIESGGGPLILLHAARMSHWSGTKLSGYDSGTTDYARACAISDDLGLLAIESGDALVLGDEPDRTAVIARGEAVFIVRWRWAPSEDALLSALLSELDALPFIESGVFLTRPGMHVLFDSASTGAEIEASCAEVSAALVVHLETTRVSLASVDFQPTRDIYALVHRLGK